MYEKYAWLRFRIPNPPASFSSTLAQKVQELLAAGVEPDETTTDWVSLLCLGVVFSFELFYIGDYIEWPSHYHIGITFGVRMLLRGPHDAMSTLVLNASQFDLSIRIHVVWSNSPDVCCFSWEDCLSVRANPSQGRY